MSTATEVIALWRERASRRANVVDEQDVTDDLSDPAVMSSFVFDSKAHDGSYIEDYARDALGLTDDESCDLFHSGNSIEDVRRAAETIAVPAGEGL